MLFQKGNPGGPGRPRGRTKHLMDAAIEAVPVDDWVKVVTKALEQAKEGDAKAREWLSKLLVGSDPLPLAQLVDELQEELEKIRNGRHISGNGAAVAGGSPEANGPVGPGADRAGPRPGGDLDAGRNDAGPLAGDATPLFG
jgi:hypothetical protein